VQAAPLHQTLIEGLSLLRQRWQQTALRTAAP
jgi:hypothetical protein